MTSPFVIGVTGGIAVGKSSVLDLLGQRGAATIDADAVYHELIGRGGPLVGPIEARFGKDMVAADGSIDRRALAGIVFADRAALADLDAITILLVARGDTESHRRFRCCRGRGRCGQVDRKRHGRSL